ncbi:Imm1 family immunity protein [Saccharopolyspora sp. NPDC000359]|uniref:Imm1 family immunity protein n=1 Tax=Saccharopolyspora sp. NPDC000359 TaxID=3154251 RepID=UPI00331B5BDC
MRRRTAAEAGIRSPLTSLTRAGPLRTIVEDPPQPVCEVYLWDRPCRSFRREGGPAFPQTGRLRVSTDVSTGWGALNHFHRGARDGLADSLNPEAGGSTPVLPFDTDGIDFSRSASLPLATVREAVAEYCRTGARPTCVQCQEGYWY